jgi:hypothetical protein
MSLIEALRQATLPPDPGEVISEFRLLCSGALYRGKVETFDWRKSDVCRLLLDGRIVLFVASRPMDVYPQELMLRIPIPMVQSSDSPGAVIMGYRHREVAADLAALLTLLLRRLISVHSHVRVLHGSEFSGGLGMPDWPWPVTQEPRPVVWRRRPLGVLTHSDGRQEVDDRSPPPVAVDSVWLKDILSKLPAIPAAKTILTCARLYSQAMELIEDRADVAYQLLIAATETLAHAAMKDYVPTDEERIAAKRGVFDKARKLGLDESGARELALAAAQGMGWTARKFEQCLLRFTDERIWHKDDLFIELAPALPNQQIFVKTLKFIYRSRSAALHTGESLAPTARLGTSPYIDVDAVAAVLAGKTSLPPVTWFERVVQSALLSFIEAQLVPPCPMVLC